MFEQSSNQIFELSSPGKRRRQPLLQVLNPLKRIGFWPEICSNRTCSIRDVVQVKIFSSKLSGKNDKNLIISIEADKKKPTCVDFFLQFEGGLDKNSAVSRNIVNAQVQKISML